MSAGSYHLNIAWVMAPKQTHQKNTPSPPPHNQAINGDVEVALKQKKKQPKIAKQSLVEERNMSIRRPTSAGKKVS